MLRKITRIGYVIGKVFVILFLGYYICAVIIIGKDVYKDTKVRSDVLVVLGASSFMGDAYNPCLVARVKHAVKLKNEGYANTLLFTGGNDFGRETNEADTMRDIAINEGADSNSILLERTATSTYENIAYSSQLMREHGLSTMILVTEPFHAPRATLVASHLGLNARISPALDSPCWQRWKYLSRYFLREPFAVVNYALTGKL